MSLTTGEPSILLVEDEAIVALDVEHIAVAEGFRVVAHATRASEALTMFQRHAPDLCLVDVYLLDGPLGVDCGRRFAAAGTPVVFATANRGLLPPDLAGALGVMPKPYTDASLHAAFAYLRAALVGKTAHAPSPDALTLGPAASRLRSLANLFPG